jgi:hypothetical protein
MRITAARIATITLVLCISGVNALGQSEDAPVIHRFQFKPAPRIEHGPPAEARAATIAAGASSQLPVWNYQVISSRDGRLYQGVMVGRDPSTVGSDAAVSVKTQVVPLVLKFISVATAVNLKTGVLTTTNGSATSDPTAADTGCFTGSHNVPLNLMAQSPIFRNADFNFGGTDVGTTEYTDAFQRANFWSLIDKSHYHVRLGPVQVFPPVVVNVPAASGLSIPANFFEPLFSTCGAEGLVDINYIDAVVVNELAKLPGITPGTFPMFMIYNTGMSFGDPRKLANCCAGGYHSINPVSPIAFQTYSPFDFDVSGFFLPPGDTATASHEVAEWMNDPYIINDTPLWGHTGQVAHCQGNLEVGDPLTGNEAPRIAMPNGYTYHLQELAFFSWFFGGPSLGLHGWFSDNGTFLTDAGPVCK